MDNNEFLESEINDYFNVIKKGSHIIASITLLVMLITAVYNFYIMKPIYVAKSSIIIVKKKDAKPFDNNELIFYKNLVKPYSAIIMTTKVAKKTIERLRLKMTPEELLRKMNVEAKDETLTLGLTVKGNTPKEVSDIVNVLSTVFIEEVNNLYPLNSAQMMINTDTPHIVDKKILNIIWSLVFGLICSIGIVIFRDQLDETVRTEEDIRNFLDIPLIGNIPKVKKYLQNINTTMLEEFPSPFMEAYRTLRTNIEFISKNNNIKSIAVTSSVPSEGKTTTAGMLAILLAQVGKKTILVDCDLRKSKVHKMFNLSNSKGLQNILIEGNDFHTEINNSEIQNLFIITSGIQASYSTDILASTKMKELIIELENEFDYVIIDTPPVGLVTDAQLISEITDGCLFVVGNGKVERKVLLKAKELLTNINISILGVSLNMMEEVQMYDYYGYYESDDKKGKNRNTHRRSKELNKNGQIPT